jgi:hypothetical protein
VVDGNNYDDDDDDEGSGHDNDGDNGCQRQWRIWWAGWPPPDEEGEMTRRQNNTQQ